MVTAPQWAPIANRTPAVPEVIGHRVRGLVPRWEKVDGGPARSCWFLGSAAEYGPFAVPFYAASVRTNLDCAAYDVAENCAGDGAVVESLALPSGC